MRFNTDLHFGNINHKGTIVFFDTINIMNIMRTIHLGQWMENFDNSSKWGILKIKNSTF